MNILQKFLAQRCVRKSLEKEKNNIFCIATIYLEERIASELTAISFRHVSTMAMLTQVLFVEETVSKALKKMQVHW